MNPDAFNDAKSPGKLVRTEFFRTATESGRQVQKTEKGWAFVPDPPPALAVLLDRNPGDLLQLQEQAVAALGRLDGFFRQSPGGFNLNPWVLYAPLRLREARLSSRIENTVASSIEVEETDFIVPERSEPIEVRNYLRAIELGAGVSTPITEALIRQLHTELLDNVPRSDKNYPGEYRSQQVFIGDENRPFSDAKFVPPPPVEVPRLMQECVGYMRQPAAGTPALFAAAIAHYQFETIHPFADGNGRLGRLLVTLSLCGDVLLSSPLIYPSGYIDQNKQEYYDRLLRVSTDGEWMEWIRYFLQAILSEAEGTHRRMLRLFELRNDFLDRVSDRSLGPRFSNAIDSIFSRSIVTVKSLHKEIGGTEQTSRNYIELMEKHNILEFYKKIGKQHIYFAPEIHVVADED